MDLSDTTLNFLQTLTSVIAPIFTFLLAILGAFTEKKREIGYIVGGEKKTKKIITPSGKVIIFLMTLGALLTLSSMFVTRELNNRHNDKELAKDKINNIKRDSILSTAQNTLDSVSLALDVTKNVQENTIQLNEKLSFQTAKLEKISYPLFPMELEYSFDRNIKLSGKDADLINLIKCVIDTTRENGESKICKQVIYKVKDFLDKYSDTLEKGISYDNVSYKQSRSENSDLMNLSRFLYDKFVPESVESDFYFENDDYLNDKIIPLAVFLVKNPKTNSDIFFDYILTLILPDTIKVNMTIIAKRHSFLVNKSNKSSWLDFNKGYLRIRTSINLNYMEYRTGPQNSYPQFFTLDETDRIGNKTEFRKRISIY